MNRLIVTILACSILLTSQPATSQVDNTAGAIQRDPQALAAIAQFLNRAGGAAVAGIQDFTASGTITFYWAGKEASGSARVIARGSNEFRMDANLPTGTRSWTVSNGTGSLRDTNGKVSVIPPHIAIALGSLTFPYLRLSAAATDTTYVLQDAGDTALDTTSVHKLQLRHEVNGSIKNENPVNHLLDATYFFDSQSHLLVSVQNQTHPVATMTRNLSHDLRFADYRNMNGVMVPFAITEYVGGQRTWSLQLESVQFNAGLSDADFQF